MRMCDITHPLELWIWNGRIQLSLAGCWYNRLWTIFPEEGLLPPRCSFNLPWLEWLWAPHACDHLARLCCHLDQVDLLQLYLLHSRKNSEAEGEAVPGGRSHPISKSTTGTKELSIFGYILIITAMIR